MCIPEGGLVGLDEQSRPVPLLLEELGVAEVLAVPGAGLHEEPAALPPQILVDDGALVLLPELPVLVLVVAAAAGEEGED